ncbi:sugar ABC transporter ATP-binding protein [Modestobacter sp. VKM Ac-2978]|uniref:sugar ABC transporter ATP-binding protein n=1 Tax=Modestobacter sp. VKM Ac-2978 TaxID=3004132 RepID=UPI0022AA3D6E|nr:sugar ABC transporter ATP-binding protein [Modestobacter sp. VKM Ac-2978]MCZ2849912.1 sugar ABC transporter ATP-binding protein [Modestobacter sp. VKM Ac-2978]
MSEIHVETRGVDKRFGGVHALRGVDVQIRRGEVHALIGENGAGKSTLGKIIAGTHRHDGGELIVDGHERHYRAPHDALRDGIAIIEQELALLPMRSVIENTFLGMEFAAGGVLQGARARQRFAELVEATGFDLDPDRPVGRLRLADQQKVEILRALARNASLIVMDEPSAALTPVEVDQLHAIIRELKARGTTVVIVSHFLQEVLSISDRITILRDGCLVRTTEASIETPERLVTSMLGHEQENVFSHSLAPAFDTGAPPILEVEGLTRDGIISDVSFSVRRGEIVGIAGLVGSGRTEVCRAIFGADPISSGTVRLDGVPCRFRSPAAAIRAGIALLPESRKEFGLVMSRSVRENLGLAHLRRFARFGVLRSRVERRRAEELRDQMGVKCASIDVGVTTLSGGNQQKVVLGRWLVDMPRVLIVDEPTRGVDVGAKAAIYDIIRDLAAQGVAVVVVSSELEEILALTHRIVVMARGRAVTELETAKTSKDQILEAAFDTASTSTGSAARP